MKLNLIKPIAFFDLESTGLDIATDRIVEISIIRINIDNSTEMITKRINPTISIPLASSKIHGIYDKDVIDCPPFKEVSHQLFQFINNCDLAGFNSNKFDVPLLAEEFLRAEVEFDLKNRKLIDVQNIFHTMEPRNLSAAYKFYCGKSIENAHSAEADTLATLEIFKAQLIHYENTEFTDGKGNLYKPIINDMNALSELTTRYKQADLSSRIVYNEKEEEIFNFGKHKGKTVKEVFEKEPSYYNWMMQGNFPLYTKRVITKIRLSMK